MTEQTNLVPKRRFKEFQNTHAWEQRKLGEMSESLEYGLNASATEYDGINKYVRITDIDDETHEFKTDSLTSPDVDLTTSNNYKLQEGDVLFARTGASVGKTYRYKKSDGIVYYAGFLIRTRIKLEFESEFVFQNTLTSKYNNFIKITSQRSGQPGVNAQEYAEFKIMVPELAEQKKIGQFFANLDHLITLHQRKLEKTKTLKSAYLSEMFPAEGEREPKRRFAGFTHAWEQRKLGDHAKYRRGSFPQPYGNKEWYDGEGAMPFVQVVDVTDQLTLVDDTKQKISKLAQLKSVFVPKGKIVVTLQGSIGRVAITQYDAYVDRTLLIYEDYEKPTDEHFWAYTIQQKFDIEKRKAPGGTIKTITKEALSEFSVALPEYEEQQKIGAFFKQLDHLITLHQRKLEKLQNIKKAYLNEMFI